MATVLLYRSGRRVADRVSFSLTGDTSKGRQMPELAPDQLPEGWSEIACTYERAFEKLTSQFSRELVRLLALQPHHRVLDVAAGTGSFSLQAASTGARVTATDFAAGMIGRLQQRIDEAGLSNMATAVMDGQALQFEDGSFDFSASVFGLIFFPDIAGGLAELRRVVCAGGRAAVVCWEVPEKFELMNLLGASIAEAVPEFDMSAHKPVWARMVGPDLLRQAMENAGFSEVSVSNMTGVLEIESPQQFWNDFTSSAPPMVKLFEQLGAANTETIGRLFVDRLRDHIDQGNRGFSAEACIGIGRV